MKVSSLQSLVRIFIRLPESFTLHLSTLRAELALLRTLFSFFHLIVEHPKIIHFHFSLVWAGPVRYHFFILLLQLWHGGDKLNYESRKPNRIHLLIILQRPYG